ncbi:hypothetical protein DCCM_2647 [Desulfocucumis palustris]|uniref:Uncharacterized protein n=1 Tax=Desulfocucumis palustris TaxID=1898651 RepID=A0A2L2XBF7_9FIRM|nr:hypothetical protein [Desulfocucumis palustris]GBF33545.1 hypothetical protein DCCM_2647 [Desulfocucumis palustris]
MTVREFISLFEQQKNAFLMQNIIGEGQTGVLEEFESWLKENHPGQEPVFEDKKTKKARTGAKVKKESKKTEKQDFSLYLDNIMDEAQKALEEKGLQINCISLGKAMGLRETSKCIKIFNDVNIFYRIGKSLPRKGKYQGQNIMLIELVMDGYKSSIFLPLLSKQAEIERRLGIPVEREMPHIENVGKYRFKLYFPLDNSGEYGHRPWKIGKILAEFICITKELLEELGCVKG